MSDDAANLEQWVKKYRNAGMDWVSAKLLADQLSEGQKNYLSSLINNIEKASTEKVSESKLERLARGSTAYIDYTNRMCQAVHDMLQKRVLYDSLDKWFEAKRSQLSFEREVVKKGIFTTGG